MYKEQFGGIRSWIRVSPQAAVRIVEDYDRLDDSTGLQSIRHLASNASQLGADFFIVAIPFAVVGHKRGKDGVMRDANVCVEALLGFIQYYGSSNALVFSRLFYSGCKSKNSYDCPYFDFDASQKIAGSICSSISKHVYNAIIPNPVFNGYLSMKDKMSKVDSGYFCSIIDNDQLIDSMRESLFCHKVQMPEEYQQKLPFEKSYLNSLYGMLEFWCVSKLGQETLDSIFKGTCNDILRFYDKLEKQQTPSKHKNDDSSHNYSIIFKDKLVVTPKQVGIRFLDSVADYIDEKFFKNFVVVQEQYEQHQDEEHYSKKSKVQKIAFQKLFNPKRWFQNISAQTYKALITRSRAKYDGSHAYMLSRKAIEEIIYSILYSAKTLFAQSNIENNAQESKAFDQLVLQYGKGKLKDYRELCNSDGSYLKAMRYLFKCMSAFGLDDDYGDEDTEPMNETDNYYMLDQLNHMFYDNDDDYELIGNISKAIDLAHDRGSLAACFVEGGEQTCKEVSNMPDDAFFEESEEGIEDQAYLFDNINTFKRMFSQNFWL